MRVSSYYFFIEPELKSADWRDRLPHQDLVYCDHSEHSHLDQAHNLLSELAKPAN